MSNTHKSISIEQLDSINVSLANRVRTMASKLKSSQNGKYWVGVELSDDFMRVYADNGVDMSDSIIVPATDRLAIYGFIEPR